MLRVLSYQVLFQPTMYQNYIGDKINKFQIVASVCFKKIGSFIYTLNVLNFRCVQYVQ